MIPVRGRVAIGGLIIILFALFLTVCDNEDEKSRRAGSQRDAQIQEQLKSEQLRRSEAEQSARAAESSRDAWIGAMAAGACAACVIALLFGIHIGSRAVARYRKDRSHD